MYSIRTENLSQPRADSGPSGMYRSAARWIPSRIGIITFLSSFTPGATFSSMGSDIGCHVSWLRGSIASFQLIANYLQQPPFHRLDPTLGIVWRAVDLHLDVERYVEVRGGCLHHQIGFPPD